MARCKTIVRKQVTRVQSRRHPKIDWIGESVGIMSIFSTVEAPTIILWHVLGSLGEFWKDETEASIHVPRMFKSHI
jgi:hypothetical protein